MLEIKAIVAIFLRDDLSDDFRDDLELESLPSCTGSTFLQRKGTWNLFPSCIYMARHARCLSLHPCFPSPSLPRRHPPIAAPVPARKEMETELGVANWLLGDELAIVAWFVVTRCSELGLVGLSKKADDTVDELHYFMIQDDLDGTRQ